jgi:hypothetical protein
LALPAFAYRAKRKRDVVALARAQSAAMTSISISQLCSRVLGQDPVFGITRPASAATGAAAFVSA